MSRLSWGMAGSMTDTPSLHPSMVTPLPRRLLALNLLGEIPLPRTTPRRGFAQRRIGRRSLTR